MRRRTPIRSRDALCTAITCSILLRASFTSLAPEAPERESTLLPPLGARFRHPQMFFPLRSPTRPLAILASSRSITAMQTRVSHSLLSFPPAGNWRLLPSRSVAASDVSPSMRCTFGQTGKCRAPFYGFRRFPADSSRFAILAFASACLPCAKRTSPNSSTSATILISIYVNIRARIGPTRSGKIAEIHAHSPKLSVLAATLSRFPRCAVNRQGLLVFRLRAQIIAAALQRHTL